MRGYLWSVVPHLKLKQTPEVFPKQDERNTKDPESIGNGITIPYWNAFDKIENSNPGISINNDKLVVWCRNLNSKLINLRFIDVN